MSTISDGATVLVPLLVLGHDVEVGHRNVVHEILGGGVDVTLREALPRRGNLRILTASIADAYAMLAVHRSATVLTLEDDDVPEVNMSYVVDGTARLTLDEETSLYTVVEVGFQEVIQ